MPAAEIRQLREDAPSNLATLCYKAVEKLVKAVDNSCRTQHEQQTGLYYILLVLKGCITYFPLLGSVELCKIINEDIAVYI